MTAEDMALETERMLQEGQHHPRLFESDPSATACTG